MILGVTSIFPLTELAAADSDGFNYFSNGIDFWSNQKPTSDKSNTQSTSKGDKSVSTKPEPDSTYAPAGKFPWSKYLDPNHKEFFKEGDYTPPEPFMEIVRNPTDENLKQWFAYIQKKNELSVQLNHRMQEYLGKSTGNNVETPQKEQLIARASSLPRNAPDADRFRFRLYFDSKCPHCKRMMGTLSALRAQGYFVEAHQVDNDPEGLKGLPIPAERAAPGEIEAKTIKSVPLLLIGDLKSKTVYRITGFQTVDDVLKSLPQGGS
jgi:hypothetical protein